MLLITQIKLSLDQSKNEIPGIIADRLKINKSELISYKIIKESLDARKKPIFIYSVAIEVKNEKKYLRNKNVEKYEPQKYKFKKATTYKTVAVVGYGPSGMFAAYTLAKAGLKVVVFERGKQVEKRAVDVETFWNDGILNPNSNMQFGEGGAGTFSDGKLTTRIKDTRIHNILDILVECGADEAIRYQAHPHIGTDVLKTVVANFRQKLIDMNVEFHFEETIEDFIVEDGKIVALKSNIASYPFDEVVLAIGHSAKDTLFKLHEVNTFMEPKDFAIGVRVEHPQAMIDKNQFKEYFDHPNLEASEYKLAYNTSQQYGVYSFCMCPGGEIVATSSEPNTICTNGMSNSKRDGEYANSAIIVQVKKDDYYRGDLFDGIKYQTALEQKAYATSNSYAAPACNIKDYLNNEVNELIFKSTYRPTTHLYDMNLLFDDFINQALHEALVYFDTKIHGFIENGIMVGPETRSSSMVRITRDDNMQNLNIKNLYPCGEGAGYAGGIISSALDGLKVAEAIIE